MQGFCPGQGTCLSLSYLQIQTPTKLGTDTHTEDNDMTSHTDCHREGGPFNSTYIKDSHRIQAQAAKAASPLGLAKTEGH